MTALQRSDRSPRARAAIVRPLAAALAAALVALAPSAGRAPAQVSAPAPAHNTLTAAERAAGWRLLFDGRSLTG